MLPLRSKAFMNHIFRDMTDIFVVIYLDEHPHLLKLSGRAPGSHPTRLGSPSRVRLALQTQEVLVPHAEDRVLGFMVTPTGISMDTAKTDTVSIWLTLTNLKAVQAFLGFANFYRRFIVGFSDIVIPLIRLTHKDTPFAWGPHHTKVFETLKTAFTQAPILVHFNPDNPIVVETDASDYAIAAIISQISPDDGDIHPIAFYSCSNAAGRAQL